MTSKVHKISIRSILFGEGPTSRRKRQLKREEKKRECLPSAKEIRGLRNTEDNSIMKTSLSRYFIKKEE